MSDDAGDQPPPAGPVSAEWPRASVSLLEAHKTLAMPATVQEVRRSAARFAELHGCDPDAYLASYGGNFVEACRNPNLPEPAQEVFKEWYWLSLGAEKEVYHRAEQHELYVFGYPATGGDAEWIPLRLLAQPHEFRRDVLLVRGERRYEDVRVVTTAQWREVASQSPAPPPQVPPLLKAPTRGQGRVPAPHWAAAREVAWNWMGARGVPQPDDGRQAALERHITKWLDEHGHNASESTIRSYVSRWIKEFTSGTKIEARKSGDTASKERLPKR